MRRSILLLLACLLLHVAGCSPYQTGPVEGAPFLDRAQTREKDGLRVTVAVPTRKEAGTVFGTDLETRRIQPVWIEVGNGTGEPFWLMLSRVDSNYYSPLEAAYRCHAFLRESRNRRMDAHFEQLAIGQFIPPHCRSRGFCFSNVKQGTKEVFVRIVGENRVVDFEFHVPVPGLRADWQAVDWDTLVPEEERVTVEEDQELHDILASFPLTTTEKDGTGQGDPLNLIVIGNLEVPFSRAGWDQTERLTVGSAWRTVTGFFGKEYKHAPMSPLHVFGRPQDMGLQKARETVRQRNHLRLWRSPVDYRGDPVWVGTVSRDIGVRFTTRAWNLMTHEIDPDVDEARDYLYDDLVTADSVERYGFMQGLAPVTADTPRRNLLNSPYWTDGKRMVLQITAETVPVDDIDHFDWNSPRDTHACKSPFPPASPVQPGAAAP